MRGLGPKVGPPATGLITMSTNNPEKRGRIVVTRHRTLSIGVAREIAKIAGWR